MTTITHPDEARALVDHLETRVTNLDRREQHLRALADEWNDLPATLCDVVGEQLWDGFLNAVRELADYRLLTDPRLPVLFEDLCLALKAEQRAANDPAAYADELEYPMYPGRNEMAEQKAHDDVDDALRVLLRPVTVVAS